jgi:hypothetical protein
LAYSQVSTSETIRTKHLGERSMSHHYSGPDYGFLGGYTTDEATRAAQTLSPDILSYDPSRPASYPGNGRTLTDDAIDVFLSILTNGKVTTDNVGPHKDLLTSFPYLGQPHKARSAELVAA